MKVLHVIPSLSTGGAERLVIDICNELDKRNDIEVKLLVFSDRIDFDDKTIGFDYSVIQSHISLSLKSSNQADLKDFEDAVTEFEPDIIHSHLFEAELLSRWKVFPNITYITHCHDNMSQISGFSRKKSFKKNITDFYEKKLLFKRYKHCNNNFIAISKDTKDYFTKVIPKALKKNIFLLSNAIDFKRFYFEKRAKPKSDKIIHAVCVGSLVDKKNQAFLIPIVSYLKTKGYSCKINVLGDGPNKKSLKLKIDSSKLNEEIILHGNVKNVEEFMHNAEFHIHPATYEPFGLVLLEAMAAGLPVISLDGKGNRDIIQHKKNGYIFQDQNAEQFGNALIELKEAPNKYLRYVKEGHEYSLNYDIKNYTNKLISYYHQIIKD
ncbi:glycosyltransferase family 4 protein [Crocinitomicaceae bacterium]|nr:glycosyltransferase family 4 protein [Crocinitomicaceae bacterium]